MEYSICRKQHRFVTKDQPIHVAALQAVHILSEGVNVAQPDGDCKAIYFETLVTSLRDYTMS